MSKKVRCAYNAWSIQIISGGLRIQHGEWPNIGELNLYDLCGEDIENLANLFTKEVESQNRWKAKQAKLNKLK